MKRVVKTYGVPTDQLPGIQFKALPDINGTKGRFEAIVSVFGNVDYQNDRVMPGAFSKSIEKWQKLNDPIPVLWSHDWADPWAHIGAVDPKDIEETDIGLKVAGTLDIDKPFARQVYDLLKSRRVKEWSFSYDVIDEKTGSDRANELRELDLIELGPTLKGANDQTETIGVKATLEAASKAGRILSSKNESTLRQARDLIDGVLASLEKIEEPVDEKAVTAWLKAEEEFQAKAVDDTEWDGNAAMTAASAADDPAAAFRAICAGEREVGDPSERQHWALPHHKRPGAPPNARGVAQARARFDQTQGLVNREAAARHLQAHAEMIQRERASGKSDEAKIRRDELKRRIQALTMDVA